jgi:tetratricopeptide (TPR) repeat protein
MFLGELPPPAPRDCFGRNELIEKLVGLAENLEPVALVGAGGIGKTSVALTVLHHNRIKERFGENRRFIRCDQFPASCPHFLARLSEVIGAGVENPTDMAPLRRLLSSKEIIIILDNAESILDPKGKSAKEIYSVVDELCQFETVSLIITSRIATVPPRCKPMEIPTLSMDAACDIFYNIYVKGGRSSIIDDLLRRLDFHALSIKLLATTASHNGWDHDRLAEEWDAQRAQVLQTDYNESLAATIELSLTSPTFHSLGPDARDLLGVVAFFPQGVNEKSLSWLFPTISNRKNTFDKFCVLSLAYRSNGFITMLAPIRDYLSPQDPLSSPLLCAARDQYLNRLAVDIYPGKPGFEEARWIVLEDVNVEHLLDVFSSIDQTRGDIWDACSRFFEHLQWHKPRQTILGSKIETLADDHHSKPKCLFKLSRLFRWFGNHTKAKQLLTRILELERQRGDDAQVAQTLACLSEVNRLLGLHGEGIRQAKGALEIFERINDVIGQARALIYLAMLLFSVRRLDAAEKAAFRAITLVSEKGEEFLVCNLRRALGEIHRSKGEKEKAIHHLKTALEIASPFNWHGELFWAHFGLAQLFRNENEFDDANTHVRLAKSHAVHNSYYLGRAMYLQACIWYWQRSRLEDAKSETSHALEIYEKLGVAKEVGRCRVLLQKVEREIQKAAH